MSIWRAAWNTLNGCTLCGKPRREHVKRVGARGKFCFSTCTWCGDLAEGHPKQCRLEADCVVCALPILRCTCIRLPRLAALILQLGVGAAALLIMPAFAWSLADDESWRTSLTAKLVITATHAAMVIFLARIKLYEWQWAAYHTRARREAGVKVSYKGWWG